MTDGEPDWAEAQRQEREKSRASLVGGYSARLWVVLPALASLPILFLFGEGDYIVLIMGALWAGMCTYGWRLRRDAPVGTVQRSRGFWIALSSFVMCALMFALSIAFMFDRGWRYTAPTWL